MKNDIFPDLEDERILGINQKYLSISNNDLNKNKYRFYSNTNKMDIYLLKVKFKTELISIEEREILWMCFK